MAPDDLNDDLNRLWQGQEKQEPRMSLDEIRQRARKLEKKIRMRNLLEYGGAVIVLVLGGPAVFNDSSVAVRIGAGLIMLAAVYVSYQIHVRGSARTMPADCALTNCLDFHRAELARQRDLVQSIWWWYLFPFVPGMAFILIGRAIERPDRRVLAVVVAAAAALSYYAIGKLNERAAHKIQRIIDGLDSTQ